jgi:hypothetical protein
MPAYAGMTVVMYQNPVDKVLNLVLLQQIARDHQLLDLARPFADDHQRRVTVKPPPISRLFVRGGDRGVQML